jgi:hypothetical protein
MEEHLTDCRQCNVLPPELREYSAKTCVLCGTLHCDECMNEAGYCTPCSEKLSYTQDEAIAV